MIDLSKMSLEELSTLGDRIRDEKRNREEQKRGTAWKKVLEAVKEYEEVTSDDGLSGHHHLEGDFRIKFTTIPGECNLYYQR